LLAAGLAALFIAGEAIRLGIATSLEDSANPTELRRALTLDPDNPKLHHRLGLVYSYAPGGNNPRS
jgi:hypothetical protein